MTKYKEFFQKMLDNNKDLFASFRKIHDQYQVDPDAFQEQFNIRGKKVQKVIREWEQKLCGRSEGSGYAAFAGNLAEKFWGEVRAMFPMIDHVGLETKKFDVKKINLH